MDFSEAASSRPLCLSGFGMLAVRDVLDPGHNFFDPDPVIITGPEPHADLLTSESSGVRVVRFGFSKLMVFLNRKVPLLYHRSGWGGRLSRSHKDLNFLN